MTENSRLRILVLGVVVVSLFAALFARLWFLQVISGHQYAAAAEGNRLRTVPREAPRGRILDRRGRVLVDNRVSNVVAVSRSLAGKQRDAVVAKLSEMLKIPVGEIEKKLSDVRYADFRPVPVATDVDEATLLAIREREDELPGVEARQVAVRKYLYGNLAAHVLGYVGEINDAELADRKDEGYRLGDTIGKVGVERAYETDLRGTPGVEYWEVDRQGQVVKSLGERASQQGDDVQLSLDLDVQRAAEDSLNRWIEDARKGGAAAPAGAVAAIDVTDGSVVAMASYPTYDPSQFVHGISTDLWKQLNDPKNHLPLNDRAIQGLYAPGSTFKIVTALAGLTSGAITPNTTIDDKGSIEIGRRRFHNAGSKAHGLVNLRRALTVSSDVFFYKLGFEINGLPADKREEIQRVARAYGFGAPTGVELPFEQEGRVPDRAWKSQVHDANPKAFPEGRWYAGDNVNLAIGQGDVLVTPLQLADAYATLANGGKVFRPHVGARVIDRFGSVVRKVDPQVVNDMSSMLTSEARSVILSGLRGAVNDPDGTAYSVFQGYTGPPVAGKTGTAQVGNKEDTSLFAGIVPASNPKYAVVAVVEQAGAGSEIAAPIVRDVIQALNQSDSDSSLPPVGTLIAPTTTSTTPATEPSSTTVPSLTPVGPSGGGSNG